MESIVIVVPELLPVPPVQGGAVEYWVNEVSRRMTSPITKLSIILWPISVGGHKLVEKDMS